MTFSLCASRFNVNRGLAPVIKLWKGTSPLTTTRTYDKTDTNLLNALNAFRRNVSGTTEHQKSFGTCHPCQAARYIAWLYASTNRVRSMDKSIVQRAVAIYSVITFIYFNIYILYMFIFYFLFIWLFIYVVMYWLKNYIVIFFLSILFLYYAFIYSVYVCAYVLCITLVIFSWFLSPFLPSSLLF